MTNRRRSGKGRTSTSKKSETPDKHSRKLTRRSKRSKKSQSPEKPEEVDSEISGDEQAEDDENTKKLNDEGKNENLNDGTSQLESTKTIEDQRSQLKEEESGGSDGSWKVKSENGGGGGIPKLKLCLTRPLEMSSPTSMSEQNPSPRRRRRGGRGNITPTKEEEQVEEITEECSKRVTRNQKAKSMQEPEVICEEKREAKSELQLEPEPEPKPEPETELQSKPETETQLELESQTKEPEAKEVYNSGYNEEEDETRMAVQSICVVESNEEKESESNAVVGVTQEDNISKKEVKHFLPITEKDFNKTMEINDESQSSNRVIEKGISGEKAELEVHEEQEQKKNLELILFEDQSEAKLNSEPSQGIQTVEKRRSSSRDSSEERAKEAALRSRNKNKKKEESEEGEVMESSKLETTMKLGSQEKNKITTRLVSVTNKSETKENHEEQTPAKLGARKRRWGSSANKTSKKPSVSISTDFLKEIIPEVKPLLMSEVQLSPNEEDEEGQLKDSEENLPVIAKKIEREKIVQSDESEKDYEEEAVESGADEMTQVESVKAPLFLPPPMPVKEKEYTTFTRKVSVLSSNEKLQKSPSPPKHKPSNILYIVNLVRPFTIPQLRELLARTGTITEDGFWIDKIKSKCFVKYKTEEEAKTTRHALHGVRWPVSNPKQLIVDFGTEAAMKAALEGNDVSTKRPIPSLFEKQIDLKATDSARDRDKDRDRDKGSEKRERNEKEKKDRGKYREDEKKDDEDKEKKSRPPVEPLVRDKTVRRVTMPVREWDVGKNEDGFSPPHDGIEFSRHRDDRYERRMEYDRDKRDDYDDRRRREKDRNQRSVSGEPPRKSKKKSEEETPAKLLDDLFRKTKATPCIYWLPLTPEQISVKEEMRRKHMAEHEKKVAELRKMQREQSKRNSDKRRRRTKSRSRSRSVKK